MAEAVSDGKGATGMTLQNIQLGWVVYTLGSACMICESLVPVVYKTAMGTAGTLLLGAAGIMGVQKVGSAVVGALPGAKA